MSQSKPEGVSTDFVHEHRAMIAVHMQVIVDAPSATIAEVNALLDSVEPALPVRTTMRKQ